MDSFKQLLSLNVNDKVEKKQNLSYLSWSFAWAEFKKVCPSATYEIKKDDQGRCYFGDPDVGYMVYTSVTVDQITHEMWLPVMDNANKAMKLHSYEYSTRNGKKSVEAMTMFDVNKAVMRCLTKNLAMFGLGLYIYSGEDLPEDVKEYRCTDCGKLFESFTDKKGKVWNAGQVYHMAESNNADKKARCRDCREKVEAKKGDSNE